MNKQITTEEAIRAMNELEVVTTFLSDTNGYSARRLSLVHRPGFITRPVVFRVRLKKRQFDETDDITERDFDIIAEAVRFYNTETKEDQSDAIGEFDAGLRILDARLHETAWRSQDLKKVFDRLLFGPQDIPDGALAGIVKRVNDSMNEIRDNSMER